jgi:uncharacterized Zn-binding protein involved in type VI secretion
LKGDSNFSKSFSSFLNSPLTILISILLLSHNLSYAQYPERIEELTRKLEVVKKQLDACGSDMNCFQNKMKQLQQLTKEIQSLQNDLKKNPEKLIDDIINNSPKETEFPTPFENITKPWAKHSVLTSTMSYPVYDCKAISDTREEVENRIDEIYKKGVGLTGPGWTLVLSHCKETNVKLTEHGKLKKPDSYSLDYKLQFIDRAVWLARYWLLVGDKQMKVLDKHSYTLGLADQNKRNTKVLSHYGWIIDYSKDPPLQLPLDHYEILREGTSDVSVSNEQRYTSIFPLLIEDLKDTLKIGKVDEYWLTLPYQTLRFTSANPELYVETTVEIPHVTFTPEEMQGFFEQGKLKKSYNAGGVTQEIEIGYVPLGCDDQPSSGKGAIVLAGDCIDHGGYVIANDKTTITANGKIVAKIGDKVLCFKHGLSEIIASNNNNVLSEKKQIARIGDKTKCGAKLLGGSMNTFAGDK